MDYVECPNCSQDIEIDVTEDYEVTCGSCGRTYEV